jgi:hypothetical protein
MYHICEGVLLLRNFVVFVFFIVALYNAFAWIDTNRVFAQSTCQFVRDGAAVDEKYTGFVFDGASVDKKYHGFILVPADCLHFFDKRMPLSRDPEIIMEIEKYFPTSIGKLNGVEYYKIPIRECETKRYHSLCGNFVQCTNGKSRASTSNLRALTCALLKQTNAVVRDGTEEYLNWCKAPCTQDNLMRTYVATRRTSTPHKPPPHCMKREDASTIGWFCRYIPFDKTKPSEWWYVISEKPTENVKRGKVKRVK